jgi:hypothetical protein
MRRWSVSAAVLCAMAVGLISTGSASASILVGNSCAASSAATSVTIVSLKNAPGDSLPAAIPSNGVITSWTFNLGLPITGMGIYEEQLKVFAPVAPNQFKVVAESELGTIGQGATNFQTRLPVQSGDLLGSSVVAHSATENAQGALFCQTKNAGDEVAILPGNPNTGATESPLETDPEIQNPVTATVEPDADGDGYGDETQDKCPTDASTHEACPVPPAPPAPPTPITLSASAAAKKTSVTVALTSTAQATVTVGGEAKLGKGKTAKLPGNTQIVAPGTLAKFTILFPAKLTAALKQTPKSKRVTLALTASAPGATSTSITVKVPGQEKAAPKHHRNVS